MNERQILLLGIKPWTAYSCNLNLGKCIWWRPHTLHFGHLLLQISKVCNLYLLNLIVLIYCIKCKWRVLFANMQNNLASIKKVRTEHLPRYTTAAGVLYTQSNLNRQVLTTLPILYILVTTAKRSSHLLLRTKVFNCFIHGWQLYKTFFAFLCQFSKLTKYFNQYG